jgi:hypothetical protein
MKRSINSLLGYTIKGTDGEIGKVEEFYFDDQTSTIRYIGKNRRMAFRKKVLISPEAFQNWITIKTLSVNLTEKNKKQSRY